MLFNKRHETKMKRTKLTELYTTEEDRAEGELSMLARNKTRNGDSG